MDPDWGIDGVRIGKSMEITVRGPLLKYYYTMLKFLDLKKNISMQSLIWYGSIGLPQLHQLNLIL